MISYYDINEGPITEEILRQKFSSSDTLVVKKDAKHLFVIKKSYWYWGVIEAIGETTEKAAILNRYST